MVFVQTKMFFSLSFTIKQLKFDAVRYPNFPRTMFSPPPPPSSREQVRAHTRVCSRENFSFYDCNQLREVFHSH